MRISRQVRRITAISLVPHVTAVPGSEERYGVGPVNMTLHGKKSTVQYCDDTRQSTNMEAVFNSVLPLCILPALKPYPSSKIDLPPRMYCMLQKVNGKLDKFSHQ